jgi:hypothetical protein
MQEGESSSIISSDPASFVTLSEADGQALLEKLSSMPLADPSGKLKTFGDLDWAHHDVAVAWLRHFG